ncbi:hypothetical protein GYMLUDRAFT_40764 [Collybiopsis luxurians FD-317 M1]|uniref:Cytochrome b561 domain-containing protein n=1 Tax=Collybiopsis luxurians FD-317 M1 TaxID=944289 RepID=A0A0D0C6D6_9AGAR|nr:hypothetical protein GYMLUDRAFT_40764 [Collybiopsis luxurians FD-317 M1]
MPSSPENLDDYELLPSGPQVADQEPQKITMGIEEQLEKAEGRNGDTIAGYAALSASVITLVVTWFVILTNNPSKVGFFLLHPTLESLAMLLITYAIMTLQPTSQPRTKAAGFSRHQSAVLYLGFPALIVGVFAIIMNKIQLEKRHFRSWHSVLGITATAWIVFQICLGGASVWFGGKALGGGMKAKRVWKYHRLSGYILYSLLLLTVGLGGALSHWGEKNVPFPVRLTAYVLSPLVCLVAILSRMRVSKMKFF